MKTGTSQRVLAELQCLSVPELIEKHREIVKYDARTHNRHYLVRFIAKRVQEQAEGGLSERAKGRISELAKDAIPIRHASPRGYSRACDPRRPPVGTELRREYGGKEHVVTVFEEHFGYGGQSYRSLSQVAKLITGKTWNGWLFFGLTVRSEECKK